MKVLGVTNGVTSKHFQAEWINMFRRLLSRFHRKSYNWKQFNLLVCVTGVKCSFCASVYCTLCHSDLSIKCCFFEGGWDRTGFPTGPSSERPTSRGRRQPRQTGMCGLVLILKQQVAVSISLPWTQWPILNHVLNTECKGELVFMQLQPFHLKEVFRVCCQCRCQHVECAALQSFDHLLRKLGRLETGKRRLGSSFRLWFPCAIHLSIIGLQNNRILLRNVDALPTWDSNEGDISDLLNCGNKNAIC